MTSAAATPSDARLPVNIPVIDLGPFIRGESGAPDVVAAVEEAGRAVGFFLVTGHGVPTDVTGRLYDGARAFFDKPEAEKRQTGGAEGGVLGGVAFSPIAEEALAATLGLKTPGDYKESLNFGPQLGGSPWPDDAGLESAFRDYFVAMETLSRHLRAIVCQAIGLPADHFEPAFVDHGSALRVINYPAQTPGPLPGQMRAGVHTDYGFLTILRSEASSGGLQVRSRDGAWHNAPSIDGAFVVNIGDAFMRWTNDVWVSTPHRVANPTDGGGARRQSIPFFLNPRADTVIEALPAYVSVLRPALYAPITYGEYIEQKTKQAFGAKA